MIRGYFKRRSVSGEPDEGEWELCSGIYKTLPDLQREMHKGNPDRIIIMTDPNIEPMRIIIRDDNDPFEDKDPIKKNTLELYYYRNGGD